MTNANWTQRLGLAVIVAFCGCGPQVKIVDPPDGGEKSESSFVALIEFDAPARTVQVVLDGNDVSRGFFMTDSQAAGLISGLGTGQHVLSVDYLSKSGFEDSSQSLFTVQAPAVVDSISTDPTTMSVKQGEKLPLHVIAHSTDDTTVEVTDDAQTVIVSAKNDIASVTANKRIEGIAPGQTTLHVTFQAFSVDVPVTVTPAS